MREIGVAISVNKNATRRGSKTVCNCIGIINELEKEFVQ
jgi:hypothetical protein